MSIEGTEVRVEKGGLKDDFLYITIEQSIPQDEDFNVVIIETKEEAKELIKLIKEAAGLS